MGLSGLGILLGSFGQSQQGFQTWMQLLVFPMIFLGSLAAGAGWGSPWGCTR
jgi:hypothetical protein